MVPLMWSRECRGLQLPEEIKRQYRLLKYANVVLHVSCDPQQRSSLAKRTARGQTASKKPARRSWNSLRIRQENHGVVLMFPSSKNIIHAGQHLPSEGWDGVLWFCRREAGRSPVAAHVPNIVATGEFAFSLSKADCKRSFLTSTTKFPGHAMTHKSLPKGCTPEIYCSHGTAGAKFIIPGLTSVDALRETLIVMAKLLAPSLDLPLSGGAGELGAAGPAAPAEEEFGLGSPELLHAAVEP